METGQLTQAALDIIEWSWNITDIIWNPLTNSEWILSTILSNSFRFWSSIVVFLLRLSVLIRVIKDSNARSYSFWFQLLAVLLVIVFTPVFGLLLYIAIRPQWWKWDKTWWRDTLFHTVHQCENCWEINKIENLYCTSCGESLHVSCRECLSVYSKSYSYCPQCGAPSLES